MKKQSRLLSLLTSSSPYALKQGPLNISSTFHQAFLMSATSLAQHHHYSTMIPKQRKETVLQSVYTKRVKQPKAILFHFEHHPQHAVYDHVPARITNIVQESPKTKRFTLQVDSSKANKAFFVFFAGQYVNIHLNDMTTSISISSPPQLNSNTIELTVQLSNHPITQYVFKLILIVNNNGRALHSLQIGDSLKVTGPLGKFYFNVSENQFSHVKQLVLIAGGLGVTPLVSILKYITSNNLDLDVTLIYSATSPQDFCFLDDLLPLTQSHKNIKIELLTSHHDHIPNIIQPFLQTDKKIDREYLESNLTEEQFSQALFYVCGPLPMVKDVSGHLQSLSVPHERIRHQ